VDGELGTATPIGYEKSVNASGNRMERAPLLTSTAQLRWLLPIGTAKIETTASFYHNSGFYFDPGDEIQQRAYNLVNLYVKYARKEIAGAWLRGSTMHSMPRCSGRGCIAVRHGRVFE